MKIICFGDSNTYGWDPRIFSTNRYDSQWPQILADITGHEVVNMGQPGREIYYRQYQFERWLDPYINKGNHDLLIIMLGTNDILNMSCPNAGCPLERMKILLNHLSENKLAERILLLAPPQIKMPGKEYEEAAGLYAAELGQLAAEKKVMFADTLEWNLPLAFDGIHLTEEGHFTFAERVKELLDEMKLS